MTIVTWELNESNLQQKFQRAVTECKDFGLNVICNKCVMIVTWKTGSMKKIKCNNHKMKWRVKYLGSETLTH
jgi:hypothetical protein